MKKVSVLIVGRNEEHNLPRLFESMKNLTYAKKNYEVVYVDDASTDKSVVVAKRYGAKVHRAHKRLGRGGIRNFALSKARYPVIAWIDADCEIVDPAWIQNMLKHLHGRTAGVSGHQMRPLKGLPRLISYLPGMMVEVSHVHEASWAPTTSSIFLKSALREVGGYRTDLITAEDLEICWRLGERGYKCVQTPQAQIVHHFRATLKGFVKQQWERGVFGAALKQKGNRTLYDTGFGILWLLVPLAFTLTILYPPLLAFAAAPAVFYFGLDGIGLFPRVIARYLREERNPAGALALVALNYVKTLALTGGIVQFQLKEALNRLFASRRKLFKVSSG